MKAYAVLLCAGSGSRMGQGANKIFSDINGKSVVLRSVEAIYKSGCFEGVIAAAKEDEFDEIRKSCPEYAEKMIFAVGGDTRQDSVYNALEKVPQDADIISIHDAARCFTSPELIKMRRRCKKIRQRRRGQKVRGYGENGRGWAHNGNGGQRIARAHRDAADV